MANDLAIQVRSSAYGMSLETNRNKSITADKLIEDAKLIETFLWGSMGPMEKPPTPMSTIMEAACATRDRILEYAGNHADESVKAALEGVGAHWNRIVADLEGILGQKP